MRKLSLLIFTILLSTSFNSVIGQEKEISRNEVIYDSLVAIMKSNSEIIDEMITENPLEDDSSAMILNDLLNLSYGEIKLKYNLNQESEKEFLAAISITNDIIEMNKNLTNKTEEHNIEDFINEEISDFAKESDDSTEVYSIVEIDYDAFQEIELDLEIMTKEKFASYLSPDITGRYVNGCSLGDLNLKPETDCHQICETYLTENGTNKRMYLPSDFDAGILGASFSPNCKNLIVYSTYDGPDYHNYYENRAEFYVFKILGASGLSSIQPFLKFSMKDWSIDNLVWINNTEIGIKLYSESRSGDGSHLDFKYFKAKIQIAK